MKKLLLSLALVLSFGLVAAACANSEEPPADPDQDIVEDDENGADQDIIDDQEQPDDQQDQEPSGDNDQPAGNQGGNQGQDNDQPSGGNNEPAGGLSGDPATVLNTLINSCDVEMAGTMDIAVSADSAQRYLGLSSEQFSQYVTSAAVKEAAINAQAHLVALIQCKDASAAAQVKSLAASGFDPLRWVCVTPEQCFVVDAGSYVLLAATYADVSAALQSAFAGLAGSSMGAVNVFYPN